MSKTPTIAMIPSAYKSGKVYSVLPSDGSGDLNFARTSEATRVNQNGLIEKVGSNVPRIDYTDGGCPKLLLEPQSTNLITHSEDFSNAYWTKVGSSVPSNTISPSGDLTAFKLVEDTSSGDHRIDAQGISTTSGSKYTLSMFLKKEGNREWFKLRDFITNAFLNVNLSNGQIGATNLVNFSGKVNDYGNGWYRVSFTFTAGTSVNLRLYNAIGDNDTNYQGDGVSGIYIWGAQLEEQSYPTSYIPTSGATATRNAETLSKTGLSDYINSSGGVLYVEMSALADITQTRPITLSNGTSNNDRVIVAYESIGGRIFTAVVVGGSVVYSHSQVDDVLDYNKIALVFSNNRFSTFINGVKVDEQLSGTSFTSGVLKDLKFNKPSNNNETLTGKVKDVRVYDTALTDAELISLTS